MNWCEAEHCVTCADEAVPMTVVRVDRERTLALCASADGARHTVEIGLIDPPSPGERVLVHAGVALVALSA